MANPEQGAENKDREMIDTQGMSQSSILANMENLESQPTQPSPWGRLLGKQIRIRNLDLIDERILVGRTSESHVPLTEEFLTEKQLNRISRLHFEIYREACDLSKPVYIQDRSGHGTYLNGEIIGKNNKRILKTNDVISLLHPNMKAFVFQDFVQNESHGVPTEITEKYFIGHKLGAGACGVVRLIHDRRSCIEYAMKEVRKNFLTECGAITKLNDSNRVMNEVRIMKELTHPCVVKLHDFIDKHDSVFMVLDYMKGGDLLARIMAKKRLSESISKLYLYQMCSAVKYLHDNGITHRDLKPDNILLQTNDEETLLKIADFGLSKLVQKNSALRTICGTLLYVAPEVLTFGLETYTKKVDVWSLGVVLFTCLSGTLPFSDDYGTPATDQIKRGKFGFIHSAWKNISPVVKSLIMKMLTVDQDQRPTVNYVLKHRWLRDSTVIRKCNSLMSSSATAPAVNSDEENFLEPPLKRQRC